MSTIDDGVAGAPVLSSRFKVGDQIADLCAGEELCQSLSIVSCAGYVGGGHWRLHSLVRTPGCLRTAGVIFLVSLLTLQEG